jgi:4-amino-4-deoxy-L-arabinose transferase-like glycosyltransferase
LLISSLSANQQRLILVGIGMILFASGLGLRDPWPADEPRFALVAREMVQSGDWLIPHRAGEIYADKPPLFFWLVAVVYAITGSMRVAFLLPSALAGLQVVLLVHDLALRLWSRRAAFLAGLALLSSVQFVMQSRSGQIDGVLLLWTTLGVYGLCRHLFTGPARGWWFAGFAAAGLGVITKGVGFLPLLLLIPARFTPLRRTYNWKMIGLGFLVTLGVILLWLVPMVIHVERSGDPALEAYRDNILFKQTGQRYVAAWHHFAWIGYHIVEVIPWAWLPLTLALPWTVPAFWRRIRRRDPRIIVLLGWVALVLIFFSLSRGKRGVYILPALPAFVLAHAGLLPALIRKHSVQRLARIASLVFAGLFLMTACAILFRPELLEKNDVTALNPRALAFALLVPAVVGGIAGFVRRNFVVAGFALLLGVLWLAVGWGVLPQIDADRSSATFMRDVERRIDPQNELGILAWKEQFALQASRPVRTFGYGRPDFDNEARDGAAWLLSAPGRRLLITAKHLDGCFDPTRVQFVEERSRHRWYLAAAEAVAAPCRP